MIRKSRLKDVLKEIVDMQRDTGDFLTGFSGAAERYVTATATDETRDASLHFVNTMRHLEEEFIASLDSRPIELVD